MARKGREIKFFYIERFYSTFIATENTVEKGNLIMQKTKRIMPLLTHKGIGSSVIQASVLFPCCIIIYMSKFPSLGIPLCLVSCSIYLFLPRPSRVAQCSLAWALDSAWIWNLSQLLVSCVLEKLYMKFSMPRFPHL